MEEEIKWKATLRKASGDIFCTIAIGNDEDEARDYIHSRYKVSILKIRRIKESR